MHEEKITGRVVSVQKAKYGNAEIRVQSLWSDEKSSDYESIYTPKKLSQDDLNYVKALLDFNEGRAVPDEIVRRLKARSLSLVKPGDTIQIRWENRLIAQLDSETGQYGEKKPVRVNFEVSLISRPFAKPEKKPAAPKAAEPAAETAEDTDGFDYDLY